MVGGTDIVHQNIEELANVSNKIVPFINIIVFKKSRSRQTL